jgi:hypothetical protein
MNTGLVNNANREVVPWIVVFLVLFAVVFVCSAGFTLVELIKRRRKNSKPLELVANDEFADDLGVKDTLLEQSGHQPKLEMNWMPDETQRPIDFLYSKSEDTRLMY